MKDVREPGHYWVRLYDDPTWCIAQVDDTVYPVVLTADECLDWPRPQDVREWGPRILSPDEGAADE